MTKMAKPNFSVVGNSGLYIGEGQVYEEFIPALQMPYCLAIYKEMSYNDPVIGAILFCVRQLIKNVEWIVKPGDDSRLAGLARDFIKENMDDQSLTWNDIIENMTSCFEYGWSYSEICYKKRLGDSKNPIEKSKYNDGMIAWRKISGRAQSSWHKWEFDEDDDNGISGMWQQIDEFPYQVYIPIEKSLLIRTTAIGNNPEGRSFLRNAYRPWYFKKYLEEIEAIGAERDLAGLPVLTLPEDVDIWNSEDPNSVLMKQAAEKMLKHVKRGKNEGVYLPFNWTLSLLASSSSRQYDTNVIINRYEQRIAATLLSDIVMLGADKVGSFALASVKKSLLSTALDAQLSMIAAVLNNYAIPNLMKMNAKFVGLKASQLPQFKPTSVNAPDLKELANYIQVLSNVGMPLFPDIDLEDYLRRSAGLPNALGTAKAKVEAQPSEPKIDPKKAPNDPGKKPSKGA